MAGKIEWIDKANGLFRALDERGSWGSPGVYRLDECPRCGGNGGEQQPGDCFKCGGVGEVYIPQIEGIGERTMDEYDPADSEVHIWEPTHDEFRHENEYPYDDDEHDEGPPPIVEPPQRDEITPDDFPI